MHLQWPDRRRDIVTALDALAGTRSDCESANVDITPWPDLTNAVHWLVDDTLWDVHPASGSIGLLLFDAREADAVQAVVDAVMGVSVRQGPEADDAAWFGDQGWPQVQSLAGEAALLLRGHDTD